MVQKSEFPLGHLSVGSFIGKVSDGQLATSYTDALSAPFRLKLGERCFGGQTQSPTQSYEKWIPLEIWLWGGSELCDP